MWPFKEKHNKTPLEQKTATIPASPAFAYIGAGQPVYKMFQNDICLVNSVSECPEVYSVINYIVNICSKVKFDVIKYIGQRNKIIYDHPVNKILNEPNFYQSYRELIKQWVGFYLITGNSYLNYFQPFGFSPKEANLFVLPSQYVQIILKQFDTESNRNNYGYDFRINKIDKYLFEERYRLYIEPEFILHKRNFNFNHANGQYLYGMSPLNSADKSIQTLQAIYDAKVVLYEKYGAVGILTNEGKDISGLIPLKDTDIKSLQADYNDQYGLTRGKNQLLLTNMALKFTPISLPIKDLNLSQSALDDFRTTCRVYNIPPMCLGDPDNTTYNNITEARKQAVESVIMPLMDDLFNDLSNYLKTYFDGFDEIKPNYNDLSELKEDNKLRDERINNDVLNGIITPNQARELKGYERESNPAMDKYYFNGAIVYEPKPLDNEK